jgi:hypothetical protein
MLTFTASRLSEGNSLFPSQMILSDNYLTIRVPGLFSGDEVSLPYNVISTVYVDTPMIGYSSIYINIYGTEMVGIHGFLQSEVTYMRDIILNQIYR